jgi:hypothetical protein
MLYLLKPIVLQEASYSSDFQYGKSEERETGMNLSFLRLILHR